MASSHVFLCCHGLGCKGRTHSCISRDAHTRDRGLFFRRRSSAPFSQSARRRFVGGWARRTGSSKVTTTSPGCHAGYQSGRWVRTFGKPRSSALCSLLTTIFDNQRAFFAALSGRVHWPTRSDAAASRPGVRARPDMRTPVRLRRQAPASPVAPPTGLRGQGGPPGRPRLQAGRFREPVR
jgi:hypothetical protein